MEISIEVRTHLDPKRPSYYIYLLIVYFPARNNLLIPVLGSHEFFMPGSIFFSLLRLNDSARRERETPPYFSLYSFFPLSPPFSILSVSSSIVLASQPC